MKRVGMCWLVAALSCTPQSPASDERQCLTPSLRAGGVAVARVGVVPITCDQMVETIRSLGGNVGRKFKDRAEVKLFVEDQVRLELLAQAALERGLDRDPDVIAAARKVMVQKLLERDLGLAAFNENGVVVSEHELQSYYERNRDRYLQPEMRRIAHIQLIPDQNGQTAAAGLIAQLVAKTDNNSLFKQLAQKYSTAKDSKDRGGELMFKTKQELAEDFGVSFANDVWQLALNDIAPQPVQSTKGWHVVRVVAVRDALARPLDEVRDEIRDRLLKDSRSHAFERYLVELRTRYPVAIYEDRLNGISDALQRTETTSNVP
ncbi:MAG: peptidyl-prolyl cis-trans isomerase [Clostridia bacterium]|nr:peptidyl-prolyl cis-trans isomerase [Deltaproteobacteria bacterium]